MVHIHAVEEPFISYRNMVVQWGQETFCSFFHSNTLTLPQTQTANSTPPYFDFTTDNTADTQHLLQHDLNTKSSTLSTPSPSPSAQQPHHHLKNDN